MSSATYCVAPCPITENRTGAHHLKWGEGCQRSLSLEERDLDLRGRPNNYLVHINLSRLLDRERDGASLI
ncbi:MAG: hypothetical protein QOI77_3723 [Blastocatellia bacterium]|jgi:hypothetical protein|nr:hypothetical protein [Blastocatellia bacterium]